MTAKIRRRPGRLRRWLVRPAVWILMIPLVALAAALLYLKSDSAAERLRVLVETQLTQALERQVTIGAARLDLLPPTVELSRVVIAGASPHDPSFLRAETAGVELGVRGLLWQRSLRLERLWIDRPEIRLTIGEDGQLDLPLPKRQGGGTLEIELGALVVDSGELIFRDLRLPLRVHAEEVRGAFHGVGAEYRMTGNVDARRVEFALPNTRPDAPPYSAAVSLALDLDPRRQLEIRSGRLLGAKETADLQGVVRWADAAGERIEPEVHVTVEARGDTDLATRLGYLDGEVGGDYRFNGRFDWSAGEWVVTGLARSPSLRLIDDRFDDVVADLRLDPRSLHVEIERAGFAAGTLAGDLMLDLTAMFENEASRPLALDLTFEQLHLQQLLRSREVDLPGLTGRLAGKLSYRCAATDPWSGQGWVEVHLRRPRGTEPARLPLVGDALLTLSDGVLESGGGVLLHAGEGPDADELAIDQLAVDLQTMRGRLDFRLTTSAVGRWTSLVAEFDPATDQPLPSFLPIAGTGQVAGRVFFEGSLYQAEAQLDLAAVTLKPQADFAPLELDSLVGSLGLTPRGIAPLRLEASHGEGALLVAGAVPFAPPEPSPAGEAPELDLTLDAVAWPSQELFAVAALELPLSGPLTGQLTLTGPTDALSGMGRLKVAPALLSEIAFDEVIAELRFDPDQVSFDGMELRAPAGRVTGSGTLGLGEVQALDFTARAEGLDLAAEPLVGFFGDAVSGTLTVSATLSGDLERPRGMATGQLSELRLAGESLGDGSFEGGWDGEQLELTAALGGLLTLEGGGPFDGRWAELAFAVAGQQVDALAQMALGEGGRGVSGDFAGTLTVAGELSQPQVSLALDRLHLAYQNYQLNTIEPATARLEGSRLLIDSLYLGDSGQTSELFLRGAIELESQELDLQLQAQLPAEWLQTLLPTTRVRGTISALGQVNGTFEKPALDGQADLSQGQVIFAGFPHSIDNLSAVALIYPDRVKLDHLDAVLAGGSLQAEGTIFTRGIEVTNYRFQAQARNFRLRYPEGWLLIGDALLTMEPDDDGRLLQGTVDLRRAEYLRDLNVGGFQLLQGLLRRQRLEVGSADEALTQTRLNVLLRAPRGVRIQNNVADLRASADLIVRGDLARPVVLGTVEAEPGGELVYNETRYELEQGLMTFSSSTRINPQIDMVAHTEVRDYDVTLNLSGSLDKLQANLASDPPLPDLEVLSLLTTGEALSSGLNFGRSDLGATPGSSSDVARGLIVGQAASVVSTRVKKLFGFDTFRIDPLSAAADSGGSARVTFGKQLTKDLFVTYSNDPSSNRDNIVKVEWQALPGLVIEVTAVDQLTLNQSENGALAVDFRWQKKF